jgi:hypothetical protein
MPSFTDVNGTYILSTNFKVMYSTLYSQPNLVPLADYIARRRIFSNKISRGKLKSYLLVRNPYDRLVSFYTNKFKDDHLNRINKNWQHCQLIFFPYLNLSPEDDDTVIAERLTMTSFEEFTLLLPEVYDLDLHLHPQSWLVHRKWRGILTLKVPFDTIFKMESDLERLETELGLDIGILDNPTRHATYQDHFTRRSLATANELYLLDFDLFGYRME